MTRIGGVISGGNNCLRTPDSTSAPSHTASTRASTSRNFCVTCSVTLHLLRQSVSGRFASGLRVVTNQVVLNCTRDSRKGDAAMKFVMRLFGSLLFCLPSHAQVSQGHELAPDALERCFQLQNATAVNAPIGTIARTRSLNLSAQKPRDDIYEVRMISSLSNGQLIFLGGPHVTSPDRSLFNLIESTFDKEKPSESYIEVNDVSYLRKLPEEKESVIATRGEPSYLGFIARERRVTVLPLEPRDIDLYVNLRKYFSADQIILTLVLREAQLVRDRHRASGERLEDATFEKLRMWNQIARELDDVVSIKNIFDLTVAVRKIWPDFDWRQTPATWFNPLLSSEDTGGRFTNEIIRREKTFRDFHYAQLLLSKVSEGSTVIALAGRNHAYSIASGYQCLLNSDK